MHKFFVENNQIVNDTVFIIGEDVNHIKNVLRCTVGDKIEICVKSTNPQKYIVQIDSIENNKINCIINEKIDKSNEPYIDISIFQGLPKSEKMEFIIQKCTELGVKSFTPVVMNRSVVKYSDKDSKKKIERWKKIAETAAKQSGRDIIPIVNSIITINDFITILKEFDLVIVAYENESNNYLKKELSNFKGKKIAILIGPEGGISEEEIKLLEKSNAKIISLGKRILRTETAPIAISSIILYELGEMEE